WQLKQGMMVGHAHPSALPDVRPDLQLAGPAQPLRGVQGRRAARPATWDRRPAAYPAAAPAGLGRPGHPLRADPDSAHAAADAPARHARYHPALAPPPDRPEVDLPAPDGPATGQPGDHRADRTARHREPDLGLPADPGRAAQARPPGQRLHDPPGPQGTAYSARAGTTYRQQLAAVPARPGGDYARRRFLPRGLRADAS